MIRLPALHDVVYSDRTYVDMKVLDGLVVALTWDHVLGLQERAGEPPVDLRLMLHSNCTMDSGSCDCRVLQRDNQYKYLGVIMQSTLKL
ncbi:hypothetical protein J6590_081508 [Homalodisca vitripennis]|nr:hypothetical protein J6590_081508 [Homalodisca vitripennis]